MFISDKFIYLYLPKTGTSFISSVFSEFVDGESVGLHNWLRYDEMDYYPLKTSPPEEANFKTDKAILGSMRNPWHWYVSLWAYGCEGKGEVLKKQVYESVPEKIRDIGNFLKVASTKSYGPLNRQTLKIRHIVGQIFNKLFKPSGLWEEAYYRKEPQNFRKWLKLFLLSSRVRGLMDGYYESAISDFAGYMTYWYCALFMEEFFLPQNFFVLDDLKKLKEFDETNNCTDFIIKLETVVEDIAQLLEKSDNLTVNQKDIEIAVSKAKKNINRTTHKDYSHYYDNETIDLVWKKEKFLIEKYHYRPPIC